MSFTSDGRTGVSVVMVDVTPIGATARHLLLEQLGTFALALDALVKLCHLGLLVLLEHVREGGSFDAARAISPIANLDAGHKLG
jgi:hypothetical protein